MMHPCAILRPTEEKRRTRYETFSGFYFGACPGPLPLRLRLPRPSGGQAAAGERYDGPPAEDNRVPLTSPAHFSLPHRIPETRRASRQNRGRRRVLCAKTERDARRRPFRHIFRRGSADGEGVGRLGVQVLAPGRRAGGEGEGRSGSCRRGKTCVSRQRAPWGAHGRAALAGALGEGVRGVELAAGEGRVHIHDDAALGGSIRSRAWLPPRTKLWSKPPKSLVCAQSSARASPRTRPRRKSKGRALHAQEPPGGQAVRRALAEAAGVERQHVAEYVPPSRPARLK